MTLTKEQILDKQLLDAAANGNSEQVERLISLGADVNTVDGRGYTPLHLAAVTGHTDILNLLIGEGADVNAKDDSGQTPLHLAASNGHTNIVKLLIGAKADVNAQDRLNKTPLHWAVMFGRIETLDALIKAGANINAQDIYGRRPLDEVTTGSDIYEQFNSSVAKLIITSKSNKSLKLEDIQDEKQRCDVAAKLKELQQKTRSSAGGSHAAKVAARSNDGHSQGRS